MRLPLHSPISAVPLFHCALQVLAAIVFTIFGGMLLLSAIFLAGDARFRRNLMNDLQKKSLGFQKQANGGWTWDLHGGPGEEEEEGHGHGGGAGAGAGAPAAHGGEKAAGPTGVALVAAAAAATAHAHGHGHGHHAHGHHAHEHAPAAGGAAAQSSHAAAAAGAGDGFGYFKGSFASFARIMGGPAVRLRLAVPEEIWPGDLLSSIGRTVDLSASAITKTHNALKQRLRRVHSVAAVRADRFFFFFGSVKRGCQRESTFSSSRAALGPQPSLTFPSPF